MLILSRKENESIIIGDNIELKVISIDKGIVKLGIDAPNSISILRSELLKEVEETNKIASKRVDDSILATIYDKLKK